MKNEKEFVCLVKSYEALNVTISVSVLISQSVDTTVVHMDVILISSWHLIYGHQLERPFGF